MSASQTIVRTQLDQMLQEALDDERRLTLTHESADGWRVFKGAFAPGSFAGRILRVRLSPLDDDSKGHVPGTQANVGITFRVGHKKGLFSSVVTAVETGASEAILLLNWPAQLQQFQRRVFERATPPREAVVAVRLWREDEKESDSAERNVRHGQLEDLSAGGMRVRLANPGEIELGAAYRCAFSPRPGKPAIVVDARARHREARDQGRASIGFQFIGLEATDDGRRILERLAKAVTYFQRATSRRKDD